MAGAGHELRDVEPPPEDEEFDADIAAIFGEEATELLEQAEAAFARWRADRADRSQVTELKRLLHTLKGGARMAGIRAMGDLSHELESFLERVEYERVAGRRGDARRAAGTRSTSCTACASWPTPACTSRRPAT